MVSVIRSAASLGDALRATRRAAGLTQADLGLQTGLRQATISSLENGDGGTLDSLFKVFAVLQRDMVLVPRSTTHPELDELF